MTTNGYSRPCASPWAAVASHASIAAAVTGRAAIQPGCRRVEQKAKQQPAGEDLEMTNDPEQDAGDQHEGRAGVDEGQLHPPGELEQSLLRRIGGPGGHRPQQGVRADASEKKD